MAYVVVLLNVMMEHVTLCNSMALLLHGGNTTWPLCVNRNNSELALVYHEAYTWIPSLNINYGVITMPSQHCQLVLM